MHFPVDQTPGFFVDILSYKEVTNLKAWQRRIFDGPWIQAVHIPHITPCSLSGQEDVLLRTSEFRIPNNHHRRKESQRPSLAMETSLLHILRLLGSPGCLSSPRAVALGRTCRGNHTLCFCQETESDSWLQFGQSVLKPSRPSNGCPSLEQIHISAAPREGLDFRPGRRQRCAYTHPRLSDSWVLLSPAPS